MTIYAGRALCLPIPTPEKPHLFIALNGARSYQETNIAFVNLTDFSSSRGFDKTRVLEPGCHEFIKKRTVVNYKDALITTAAQVQTLVSTGKADFMDDFSGDILERIQMGALQSKYTPRKIQAMVKDYLCL